MTKTNVRGTQVLDASIDLTVDVTGTLPVANGGTGAATLAATALLLGNGTGAIQTLAVGTNKYVVQSNGSSWVAAAIYPSVVTKTTTYTAVNLDYILADATSAGFTITLPTAAAGGAPIWVKKSDSTTNWVTLAGTIDGATNYVLTAQYQSITLFPNASGWWIE